MDDHILPALLELCIEHEPGMETLRDAAETLSPFGTAFRYPGEETALCLDDAEEAMRFAEEIMEKVSAAIPGAAG